MRFFRWFAFCSIAINCSTIGMEQSFAPPIQSLMSDLENRNIDRKSLELLLRRSLHDEKENPMQWWIKYQLAQVIKDERPEESCSLLKTLASDHRFPIRQVAQVKTYGVCPVDNYALSELTKEIENGKSAWLNPLRAELGIERARLNNDNSNLAKLLYFKSLHSNTQSEKVELIKEAQLKLPDTEKDWKEKIENRLARIAPRLSVSKSKKVDDFDLAMDFRRARQFQKALSIYRRIAKTSRDHDQVYRAYQGIRVTYKLSQDSAGEIRAVTELERVTRRWVSVKSPNKGDLSYYLKAALTSARTLWTEDQTSKAIQTLETVRKTVRGKSDLDEVNWILARIKEERQDFSGAAAVAAESVGNLKEGSEIWVKVKWQLAWNLRKQKEYLQATQHFEDLINQTESDFIKAKATYWMARSYLDGGDKVRAYAEFERLTQVDSLGYYGILAFRALGKSMDPLTDGNESGGRSVASEKRINPEFVVVDWLVSLSEIDLAKELLSQNEFAPERVESKEQLMYYLARAQEYNKVFAYLASSENDFRNELVLRHPKLLFPRPHFSIVSESATKFGVRPELIYSIMRQESAFNRFARSHADAFGLMQMLPNVAKRTATNVGIRFQDPEDLFEPDVSIPLGAKHLRELLDKFDEQFILTVASYNASERAVRGWVKTRFLDDPTEFIEDIPYEETQLYIKLVLRNLVFYQRLLSSEPTPFPEWCLNGLQPFKS
ncbi:MAG: lytic transglycosylase domain-containing protein [Bdellovibrionales bacterium]|nr:lytic transglycosylase domain-containing protein [Bdellovibrionales bacterium]